MRHILPVVCVLLRLALGSPLPAAEAVRPEKPADLFNGRDFTGLYVWAKGTGRDDPKQVFSVRDGLIHCTGEVNGVLTTEQAYRDYHVSVEYKWGEKIYGSKYVRNSGLLLHGVGPDGGANGNWLTSIEVQLAQGCVGDLIVIRGKDEQGQTIPATLTSDTVKASDGKTRWQAGGQKTVYSGKQFWWSQHEAGFQELIDTRGKQDVDSPLGEWTKVECICQGDRVRVLINGHVVNEAYDVFPAAGKIMLQSEGFEVWFRNFKIKPLAE